MRSVHRLLTDANRVGDQTNCSEISLDLAPYRLNETEFAIGIRWNQHEEFPAGESDDKQISLLRLKDGKLVSVLDTNMSSQSEQRGPGEMIRTLCTLSIKKTKTKGFNDIQKRCAITVSPIGDTEDGAIAAKGKKRIETTQFLWNGIKYVEKGSTDGKKD